jgi:hypothetical protein
VLGADAAFEFEQPLFDLMDAKLHVTASDLEGMTASGLGFGVAVEFRKQICFNAAHEFGDLVHDVLFLRCQCVLKYVLQLLVRDWLVGWAHGVCRFSDCT